LCVSGEHPALEEGKSGSLARFPQGYQYANPSHLAFQLAPSVGITASRTANPAQLGSVAITDNRSWMFSRHCTGGKIVLRMANKLTDGGNGRVDKYGP